LISKEFVSEQIPQILTAGKKPKKEKFIAASL